MHYAIGQMMANPEIALHDRKGSRPRGVLPLDVQTMLRANPIALNVGTLGPDFLFFNIEDWPVGGAPLANAVNDFTQRLVKLRGQVMEAFPLAQQTVDAKKELEKLDAAAREHSAHFRQLRELQDNLSALLDLVTSTVTLGIKDLATSNIDIFSLLGSPITGCERPDDWWWFDVLHYAKTGQFAEHLLRNSRGDAQAHAYAVGYLTHVAADTVGHPYVNNIVRGPYRTHSQRHKVVEQFQDVALWQRYWQMNRRQFTAAERRHLKSEEFTNSELHRLFRYNRDVATHDERAQLQATDTLLAQALPDFLNVELPDNIAKLVANAATDTYGNSYGRPIGARQVKAAYRNWYTYFAGTTTEGVLPTSLPHPPPLDREIQRWVKKVKDSIDRAFDAAKDLFSGGFDFSLRGLRNFFKKLAKAALAAAAAAAAIIDVVSAALLTIPVRALHWLMNELYKMIYRLYDYFRLSVSLNGFAFPAVRHLNDPRVRHMTDPGRHPDANGNWLRGVRWAYPLQSVNFGSGIYRSAPQEAHLIYPPIRSEMAEMTAAPDSYAEQPPSFYGDGPVGLTPRTIADLRSDQLPGNHNQRMRREHLGNARDLTTHYYERALSGDGLPDLNLDGDRGMATPCWTMIACDPVAAKTTIEANYADPTV